MEGMWASIRSGSGEPSSGSGYILTVPCGEGGREGEWEERKDERERGKGGRKKGPRKGGWEGGGE